MSRFPRRPPLRAIVAALLVPPVLVLASAAQEAERPPSETPPFVDVVNVHVVNVDVYVTDRDGKPVTGLGADDFEVLENGRRMKVTNFYAVEDRRVRPSGEPAEPAEAVEVPSVPSVAPVAPVAAAEVPEDQKLSLIVYVDNLNLRPHDRRRVLHDVRSFLGQEVAPEDRMMLVTFDRSLHVREPFTHDAARIVTALYEVDEISGLGLHADSERREVLTRIDDAEGGGEALMWAEQYAESVKDDLEYTIDALREMVTSLAGLPGRKAVLYVSGGVPMIAAEDVFYAVDQKFQGTGAVTRLYAYDSSRRFEELAAHANAHRVSFYTIDAGGLRVASAADAQVFQANQAGAGSHIDRIRTHNVQSPLRLIAEKTGGKAIINQNRVGEALATVAHDFRTYYSLGYAPAHSGDGRYYRIEVRLKDRNRRGLELRHREGYRDREPEAVMNDGILAALNFPYASNPMNLDLEFAAGSARDSGHVLVPIRVRVPLSSLTLIPRGGTYEASAKLYMAAMDERGWVSDVQRTSLPIRIAEAELDADGHYVYTVEVLMRPGAQKIAIGVRDEIAASYSFVARTHLVR